MAGSMRCGLWAAWSWVLWALWPVSRGKVNFKPLATDLLSRGIDVKDALMSKVEALKEDVEDLTAEARQASEKRKTSAKDAAKA